MLVRVKKIYKKLPLGAKLKIRKYVLHRDNSKVKIKGKTLNKIDIEPVGYTDTQLFNKINQFSSKALEKRKNSYKFDMVSRYTEYRNLPIENDTILFETFHGKSMTDNPYALFLEIVKRDKEARYKFIWVLNHNPSMDIQAKRFEGLDNLIFVKLGSDDYIKYLATAKYLINNTSFPPYFVRRKEQKYLNTWHGTPLKTLGKDMKGTMGQHKNLSRNFLQTTHILSPNKFTGDILVKSHDLDGIYQGKIIEEGYPRVDLITNTNANKYKKEILGKVVRLREGKKIALYAPTWRGEVGEVGNITSGLLKKYRIIADNLPENYQLLLKVHPLLYKYIKDINNFANVVIPDELDVCEIMSGVDLLITDYSSVFVDFLVKDKPVILYQYDQDEYLEGRGMYLDLNKLSFPIANTDEEMKVLLHNVDELSSVYKEKQEFVYTQNGVSSQKVVDNLLNNSSDMCVKKVANEQDNILVYCSSPQYFKADFINSLVDQNDNILLWFSGKIDNEAEEFFKKLDKKVKIFFEFESVLFTSYEWCEYQYLMKNNDHYELKEDFHRIFKREIQRSFSEINFSKAYYLGDLQSKHYLSLMEKGLDCPLYIPYNSVESILDYQKAEYFSPKLRTILEQFNRISNVLLSEKSLYESLNIRRNDISYEVLTLSESKAYLIPSEILIRKNIILIFRNNKGKQLQNLLLSFFNDLYDEQRNYIIYASREVENQLKKYDNIYFIPNNIDRELYLHLLANEDVVINFSNAATDKNIAPLIKNKNEKSYLFNYDPLNILSGLSNNNIISLKDSGEYALKVKNFLLQQEINALRG